MTIIVPLKSEPGTFSDDHTWIGPGKESDILWAKEYQIMSDHKFIKIDDPRKYNIPPGQEDSDGVNFYSISVYHQLHCLVSCPLIHLYPTKLNVMRHSFERSSTTSHCHRTMEIIREL